MTKTKITNLTVVSLLSAIVAVISFIPLKTLGLEISFAMVPVAVGAICFGPGAGAVLGAVFGTVSFLQCFGYSAFGAMLISENPVLTFIMCIPTRILAGYLTGLIFTVFKKTGHKGIGYFVASLIAPLLNTVFFMSALVLCFYNTETIQGFVNMLSATNPFIFVILFVGINGLVEIIAGFVVAYPVSTAISKYLKL